ncbi:MAG: indole-3-glycerol-phosphate synthase [Candidatus Bipolaricaulia bacterium]
MDYLDKLAQTTIETVKNGYYTRRPTRARRTGRRSFVACISNHPGNPIVAEIKPASPSQGRMIEGGEEMIAEIASCYWQAGAAGISVLTEPVRFGGALAYLNSASAAGLPVLMKDFLLDPVQIEAGTAWGADAILLILTLFRRRYATVSLAQMIDRIHEHGLEVLLEVSSAEEFRDARETAADMIGINNRNLATLELRLETTEEILAREAADRPVWGLSGVFSAADIRRLKVAGVDAFLIGTSLMLADDRSRLLEEFICA